MAKTKCNGLSGQLKATWIFWIFIKSLISLPCVFSACLGVNVTVAVYPQGDISIPYGSPLEIFCIAENYSSSDLEFKLAGKTVPSEIVNSSTIRLYIERPEKQVNTYYCKNNKTKKICTNRVLVDSPPGDVTDFDCLSKNLDVLNCSWTSPEKRSNVNYSLTFMINGHSVQPCHVERVDTTRFCNWNTSSQPRYRQQEEVYFFNLKSCNVFGCNEQNISIDHFSIVKPDPPINLKVLSNGTHSVTLQWSIPNNMVDLLPCGVQHKIEYQIAKIDNTAYFHSVDASSLPSNNKTYRFQLRNLPFAHMQYEVRVYIKSNKAKSDEFWSMFSYVVFYTASERPSRPPEITAGAFDQAIYNSKRVIYVYWKQLEEYEEAGANFTYKVIVMQENKKQTLFPDKNKSLSYVVLNGASLEAIEIMVWSFNVIGSSVNYSYLYIPSESETHFLSLTSFTKLAYENGTYELSWDGVHNIDNYTLFWCQHNTTKICAGRMNFTVLKPEKSNHVINLPREHRYQFAISANKGMRTSGMVWAKCDISKDGIAMYGFPVHLDYDAPGKSFVKLKWSMDCALQDGIITGYKLTYCPVIRTSSLCDSTVGNQSVYISDPKKMYMNITNLLPFRTYQFTIALNTTYGLKSIENTTAVITTSEDTPTSPRNITISNVKNDSLVISWDPPLHRNGIIGKYVIYNYGNEFYVDKISGTDLSKREVTLTGLQGFTNYSFTVQACNIPIGLCSKINPNDVIFVRTRIGPPSKLKAPSIRNNPDLLKWEAPEIPAGTVDMYQIKVVKDDRPPEIYNTTNLSYSLIHCEGVVVGETYQVRAINFDEDPYHGVLSDSANVLLPRRKDDLSFDAYKGEWSEPSTVACRSREGLTMTLILMCFFAIMVMVYGSLKLYKKYSKMEDIKPVLPNGLGIPEKDISKYTFGGWNAANNDEKLSADEMLLLPNKAALPTPDIQQKDSGNCGASNETDSTILSDTSRAVERQISESSQESNDSSVQVEVDYTKRETDASVGDQKGCHSRTSSDASCSSDRAFQSNPHSGYVQSVAKLNSGYVQSSPAPLKNPSANPPVQSTSTSYVMAGLSPHIFTTGVAPPRVSDSATVSGYVSHGMDPKTSTAAKSWLPNKMLLNLPRMPILPVPSKAYPDTAIQLQSSDNLPISKTVRSPQFKPASNGYVSTTDAVVTKHLNNMLSSGQLADDVVVDPAMSADAYCRFSWSMDPANDSLNS